MKYRHTRSALCCAVSLGMLLGSPVGALAKVTYGPSTRRGDTWVVEGNEYGSEGEAEAAADAKRPEVTKGSRRVDVWEASDGKVFNTEEDAVAWASYQNGRGEWKHDGHGWWYAYSAGGYPADSWDQIEGIWYHFDTSGYMQTGWINLGSWYWLDASGAMATGWRHIGGSWYYLNGSGAMVTGWANVGARGIGSTPLGR